jgi:hypothetical protein
MPVNSFSVGRDLTFTLVGPTGNLTINGLTDYGCKPMFSKLKHKGLDGENMNAAIPDGWEISIKLDRQDATIDNFFAALEASYFAGQNIASGTISENIVEADGSITQFQYTKVSLTYDDAGSWRGDSLVPISLTGSAARRNKVS